MPVQYLSAGQFYDSDVQILRGPQGVQFGRVTNGGNIMLNPKQPTNEHEAEITLKAGDYALKATTGYLNVPVVDDLLSVRFAWDAASRKGFTENTYNNTFRDDLGYYGGRFGVKFTPSDRFENYTVAMYQKTSDNGTGIFTDALLSDNVATAVGGLFPLVNLASELGLRDPVYGINPDTGGIGAFGFNGNTLPLNVANYVGAIEQHVARQAALGKRKIYSSVPSYNRRKYFTVVNTSTFDFTDTLQFKSILGYTRYIERSAQNYSGDNSGYVRPCHGECPFVTPPHDIPFWNHEQLSAEVRFSGQQFDGRLNWSLGGYLDKQQPAGPRENDTIFGGILEYLLVQRAKTKSRAVYGYAEFDVTEKLKINGGLRYTHDTVDSFNANYNALLPVPGLEDMVAANLALFGTPPEFVPFVAQLTANSASLVPHGRCEDYNFGAFSGVCTRTQGNFNSTTWTIGTSYQFTPRQLVYIKYSKGYRPGGVNATFPAGFENLRSFSPENNFSFEAGVKAEWDIGAVPVRTNLAVFKDRYKKIQQSIQIRDTNGNPGSIVTNVAAAGIWGIEFEGTIRPFDGFTLGANYSYTHARFKKDGFNLADINTPGTATYDACNNTIPLNIGFCPYNRFSNTPTHQLGANFQWDFIQDSPAGDFGVGGNVYYQSSSAQGNGTNSFLSPGGIQDPYATLNLNGNWNNMLGKPIDLLVFVTNVTNKRYWVSVQSNEQFSSIGNRTIIYAPPRMWGAAVTVHF